MSTSYNQNYILPFIMIKPTVNNITIKESISNILENKWDSTIKLFESISKLSEEKRNIFVKEWFDEFTKIITPKNKNIYNVDNFSVIIEIKYLNISPTLIMLAAQNSNLVNDWSNTYSLFNKLREYPRNIQINTINTWFDIFNGIV